MQLRDFHRGTLADDQVMLDDALRYAAMGWPVLPLYWMDGDECSCRRFGYCRPGAPKHEECSADKCEVCTPGKHPFGRLVPNGPKNATAVFEDVRKWWTGYPKANIGIACQRFIVIDIDPRNGGNESMAELVRLHGRLPETPVARTGSGGLHYLFDLPSFEMRGQVGHGIDVKKGVDVKKPGGYIVAAPSRTVGPYRWLRPYTTPLATLPSWLQSLVKRSDPPPAVPIGPLEDVTLERRVERARAYLEHVEPAVQGQNGSTKTLVAAAHAARGFALPLEHAFFAMSDWNQRCQPPWNDRDLKRKIDEALRKYEGVTPGQHLARR